MLSRKIQLVIIVLATLLAYSNVFGNDFVIDDESFIKTWPTIQSFANIPQLLTGDVPPAHAGVYRPIRSVLYAVYYQLFGTNPWGWHVHSLVVHLISTVLVHLIIARILEVGSSLPAGKAGLPKVLGPFGRIPVTLKAGNIAVIARR